MADDGYSWGEVKGLSAEESIQLCEAVVVPVNDIKRLEEARAQLCGMIDKGNPLTGQIHFGITDIMWEITHRKYKPEESADPDKLASFPCPSFSRSGSMCVFASMKDIENKKGLRCKSEACQIRIPLET